MHEVVVTIVENIERPCNTCIYLEDVNKGTKNMANGRSYDITPIKMPRTHHWIMTVIGQPNKQGFPNDWLMNWITPIFKARDKNEVSNYRKTMVTSTIAKLYNTIM